MDDGKGFVIRAATIEDVRGIYLLIRDHSDNLVPRSINDIVQNLDRFMIAEAAEGTLVGSIAYTLFPEIGDVGKTLVELQSVCVRKEFRKLGIGKSLVMAQLAKVHALKVAQVIVLTFTPEFFGGLGFKVIDKRSLMHKIYIGCINCTKHESPFTCPEIAMSMDAADLAAVLGTVK
ncbi:MAG: GNAT family N-acetyltransferase [Kiritimatiellaeota bacterium]|nr:GNAT family N-acetyltransferase [Kiritimatiellota bacterium]